MLDQQACLKVWGKIKVDWLMVWHVLVKLAKQTCLYVNVPLPSMLCQKYMGKTNWRRMASSFFLTDLYENHSSDEHQLSNTLTRDPRNSAAKFEAVQINVWWHRWEEMDRQKDKRALKFFTRCCIYTLFCSSLNPSLYNEWVQSYYEDAKVCEVVTGTGDVSLTTCPVCEAAILTKIW